MKTLMVLMLFSVSNIFAETWYVYLSKSDECALGENANGNGLNITPEVLLRIGCKIAKFQKENGILVVDCRSSQKIKSDVPWMFGNSIEACHNAANVFKEVYDCSGADCVLKIKK